MILGFCGAASTGKSWVAGKLATQLGWDYQPSRAAEIAEQLKFDVNAPHTFGERMVYQRGILNGMLQDLLPAIGGKKNIVFDRTPIDLMAFAIIASQDEKLEAHYYDYINVCRETAVNWFDLIILVSPPYEELKKEGEYKPGRLKAEIHGYDFRVVYDRTIKNLLLYKGLSKKVLIIPENLHFQDRVDFVKEYLNETGIITTDKATDSDSAGHS